MATHLNLEPGVDAALDMGDPVVALESAVITHGVPSPHNLDVARGMQSAVRSHEAVPAIVAIINGRIRVGLSDTELQTLAVDDDVVKVTRRDLPSAVTRRLTGGTTVAGTMVVAHWAGIGVVATGGIGGVHRGNKSDVSADLPELSRTPLVVVCSGPKAILDIPSTMEWLETNGVPIIGYRTDDLPSFYSRSSGLPVEVRADTPEDVAQLVFTQRELGLTGSSLVVVPVPNEFAIPEDEINSAIEEALGMAKSAAIRGNAVTPFLLERLGSLTGGASLESNLALLTRNAQVAAQIAVSMHAHDRGSRY
jgi:pseudouridine-5'-phosphate glycosidase